MPYERSAGAVIFHEEEDRIEYLVLQYAAKHWDFPRGNVEKGEKDEQTVRREVAEETGLTELVILPGFREKVSWFYRQKGKPGTIFKEAVYYLARARTREVRLSSEHCAFAWLPFKEALERLTFENSKKVVERAAQALGKRTEPMQRHQNTPRTAR